MRGLADSSCRARRDLFGEASGIIEPDVRRLPLRARQAGKLLQGFRGKNKAGDAAKPVFDHPGWLEKARSEALRSTDLFIEHYKGTYQGFPDLPIWMLTEICSFGTLSRLWDKRVRIESAIPPGRIWDPIRHVRQDAYTSLVIHKWMLKGCKIDASLVDGWCGRVNACLAETGRKYPAIFKPYSETALAANPIWNAPAKDLRARRK